MQCLLMELDLELFTLQLIQAFVMGMIDHMFNGDFVGKMGRCRIIDAQL